MRFEQHPDDMREDYTCTQHWEHYTEEDHAIWRELFDRQSKLLVGRACDEYLQSLPTLGITAEGIPDFNRMSDILNHATGWTIVTVPGLIPGEVFLEHLSKRRFPVTYWIRTREQMDYLAEPDIFHDLFGHVPMLMNPIFADYMQEFGRGSLKAATLDAGKFIDRLYWYTVEFGLINTPMGLRIYGSGIVSSKTESIYCLDSPRPNRIGLDLKRVMRSTYDYENLQETYFVINSFEELFDITRPDFTPFYEEVRKSGDIEPWRLMPEDKVLQQGTVVNEKH